MKTLSFSELNEDQKKGAALQMHRFNRNFNFPRAIDWKNEEVVLMDAEMGLVDEFFTFRIDDDNEVNSFACVAWDTVSPDYLKIKATV